MFSTSTLRYGEGELAFSNIKISLGAENGTGLEVILERCGVCSVVSRVWGGKWGGRWCVRKRATLVVARTEVGSLPLV
jgi:hypothetical protein